MISSDEGAVGDTNEEEERSSRRDDAEGGVVTFGSMFDVARMGGNKLDLPANMRTSRDGEKETVCT